MCIPPFLAEHQTYRMLAIPTTIVAPGTLSVARTQIPTVQMLPVRKLAISDPTHSPDFQLSRPVNGPESPDNTTLIFLDYRTTISRIATLAGSSMQILPLKAPAVNSSWEIQFFGPYVDCFDADDTTIGLMKAATSLSSDAYENTTEVYRPYFAYVPDLSSPGRMGLPSRREIDPSWASNQLWLSFAKNGTGWQNIPFPKCPLTHYRVCELYNASYSLKITFQDGSMSVQSDKPKIQNKVPYPIRLIDEKIPDSMVQAAYSGYMWALTDILVGSMTLFQYTTNSASSDEVYSTRIKTGLKNTSLLGSSDLNCFFGISWMFSKVTWQPPKAQRQKDIDFARNGAGLDVLIPELSANLTITLMTNELLT
jgi:hypothetical protein